MKTLDIIIVNWNSGKQLYECVKSIQETSKNDYNLSKVIIVDNDSKDNSLEYLEGIEIPLKIIRNNSNRGFGAACNQGAQESTADYLLFLNPDTILFDESLTKPIFFMNQEENSNVGVCGIQLVNEKNIIQRSCCIFPQTKHFINRITGLNYISPKRFPTYFMSNWDHTNTSFVDHVIGAFYLVRKNLFDDVNGFDEDFFVYLEDLDLSYRIKKLGKKIIYFSEAQAFHKGGGTSEQVKAKRLFYSLRSRIVYIFKHFSISKAVTIFFATTIIEPITRVVLGVFKGSFRDVNEVLKAYSLLWKDLSSRRRLSK